MADGYIHSLDEVPLWTWIEAAGGDPDDIELLGIPGWNWQKEWPDWDDYTVS